MDEEIKGILTPKQKKVLNYIQSYYVMHGYGASYKEIAQHMQVKSEGSVGQFLDALEEKGYISRNGQNRQVLPTFPKDETSEVLLLGVIPAGSPIEPLEVPEPISVPKSMLPSYGSCYALRVRGESMIDDGIADGDIILIRHQNTADNGDVVVAITENGATLKRYYTSKGVVRLEPRNPKLNNIYPQQLEIRGRFLGLIRTEL